MELFLQLAHSVTDHHHFGNHWLLVSYGAVIYNVINLFVVRKDYDKDKSGYLSLNEIGYYVKVQTIRILLSFLLIPLGVWGCKPIYSLLATSWPDIFPTFAVAGDLSYIIMGSLPAFIQLLLTKFGFKK